MTPDYLYLPSFLENPSHMFSELKMKTQWDRSMASRNTACFGQPYNYNQIIYPYGVIPHVIRPLFTQVQALLGWIPNSVLLNHYQDGMSSMGFHSDDAMPLRPDTGVVIVSVGSPRLIRFRAIKNHNLCHDLILQPGSLLHLTDGLQQVWQHAIPKQSDAGERISITMRRLQT